jgi:hypothetical protein
MLIGLLNNNRKFITSFCIIGNLLTTVFPYIKELIFYKILEYILFPNLEKRFLYLQACILLK